MIINVIDVDPADVVVGAIQASVVPIAVNEDTTNDEMVAYYFGQSIAGLVQVGEDQYRTSIYRYVDLVVEVSPLEYAPLIEWRIDGTAALPGPSLTKTFGLVGIHALAAGPPAVERTAQIETYRVTIVSPDMDEFIIPEGEPVTFTAVTDPVGFEEDITWIAATKYGTAEPRTGTGPSFTAQFDDTYGPHPDGGLWQWLGAKADNATAGQDQKPGACCLEDVCGPDSLPDDCAAAGGVFLGEGVECAADSCDKQCIFEVTSHTACTSNQGACPTDPPADCPPPADGQFRWEGDCPPNCPDFTRQYRCNSIDHCCCTISYTFSACEVPGASVGTVPEASAGCP